MKIIPYLSDAEDKTNQILDEIPQNTPAFFFIDPYWHPLSIPTINKILNRRYTETFVNLMWYRINMDINNSKIEPYINKIFGNENWKQQSFVKESGNKKEQDFLEYFLSQIDCSFKLDFKIHFSPEDQIFAKEQRTKYYLIHLSNHIKAVLLMKEIMYVLGDVDGTFDYSGTRQGFLFSPTPPIEELKDFIRKNYLRTNKEISFDKIREETYCLPFVEKHYREVLRESEKSKEIIIKRIESKRTGIKGKDLIIFQKG